MSRDWPTLQQLRMLTNDQLHSMVGDLCVGNRRGLDDDFDIRWVRPPEDHPVFHRHRHVYCVNASKANEGFASVHVMHMDTAIGMVSHNPRQITPYEASWMLKLVGQLCPGAKTNRFRSSVGAYADSRYSVEFLVVVFYYILTGVINEQTQPLEF